MKEQLISLETAKLAKDKGFSINIKKSYVETIEHTLELGRGGDCTFPYIAPRVLENRLLDEWHIEIAKAPTQSLLQKYLREVHNIDVDVTRDSEIHFNDEIRWIVTVSDWNNIKVIKYSTVELKHPNYQHYIDFKSYEEALEQGLIEGLKLVK